MATRYSDYERGSYGRHYSEEEDRSYRSEPRYYGGRGREDRGFIDRAGDEVRSWFGDEEAERRRRMDEGSYRRASGRSGDGLQARDVMTRDVIMAHPEDRVAWAARQMEECDCGALPVVDRDGRLIGMITDRDIAIRLVARGEDIRRARVGDCMTDEAFACHAYDAAEDCMRAMSRHQVRRIPIVDDRNRVIGIVSQADLAQHAGSHQGRGERRAVADVVCAVSKPTQAYYY